MQKANQPDYLVSLEDALANQNSFGRPLKTFVGYNTGNRTFTLLLSLFELHELTEVANDQSKTSATAQRKLDMVHATAIAKYIIKGLLSAAARKKEKQLEPLSQAFVQIQNHMGTQPYLAIPPLVASFRNCSPNGTNLKVAALKTLEDEVASYKIYVNNGDTFWIIDGQHRRKAVQLVYEFLDYVRTYHKYPGRASLYGNPEKKGELSPEEINVWLSCMEMLKACNVTLEVHLGLSIAEERQLFHDLNNLAKKVEKSLAYQFDLSNAVNSFIKHVIIEDIFESSGFPVLIDKESGDWNKSGLTHKELVAINAILFLNKTNISGAVPSLVEPKVELAQSFWERIVEIDGMLESNSKHQTVAAQVVVLKALAKLVYDFYFGKNKEWNNEEYQKRLFEGILSIDFSHSNPMWRYYELSEEQRKVNGLEGLSNYLPSEDEGFNRDIGKFDEHTQLFRFGAKHNDIYPIIGDMIRWSLDLPVRHKN